MGRFVMQKGTDNSVHAPSGGWLQVGMGMAWDREVSPHLLSVGGWLGGEERWEDRLLSVGGGLGGEEGWSG